MKKFHHLILTFFLSFAFIAGSSHLTHADPPGAPGYPPTGGASCNWDAFLERLGRQETGFKCSGGGPCDAQYTTCSDRPHDPSCGKWQFIPSTWDSMVGQQYPQCKGMNNAVAPECWPVQRWATEQFMARAVNHFKGNGWCGKLGQTVTGTHQGTTLTCTISKSGLLSAYHNAGTNACAFANGTNKWTSQINWRICDAGNIPFPEDCTPSGAPPTVGPNVTPGTPTTHPSGPGGPGFDRPTHFEQLSETLKNLWIASMQQMTTQITTTMMMQVQAVGMFLDAKHQLETQRLLQLKHVRAYQKFRPTVQMCAIGTMMRDAKAMTRRADMTHVTLTQKLQARASASGDTSTVEGNLSDKRSRLAEYITSYCSINDNRKNNRLLCKNTSAPAEQQNLDIDFTRLLDLPLTLNVDFLNAPSAGATSPEDAAEQAMTQKAIFAFLDNIFMHEAFPDAPFANTTLSSFVVPSQDARALMAMRSVAMNSFSHYIAMKTAGHKEDGENSAAFLKAFYVNMGINPEEAEERLGRNPSMNALYKLISEIILDPKFIERLYTNEENLNRLSTFLEAFKVMQERKIKESMERRQALHAVLLEIKLREKQADLQVEINSAVGRGSMP